MRPLQDQRSYGEAIETTRILLRHDPLAEGRYRRLMRLQALGGGKADALRTYHTFASLLSSRARQSDLSHDKFREVAHVNLSRARRGLGHRPPSQSLDA